MDLPRSQPVQPVASRPRRGQTHRWILPDGGAFPGGSLRDRILAARGLSADAGAFLQPSLQGIESPIDRTDFAEASGLLAEAIRDGKSIAIYGDYDVDGITATAILYHAIRAIDPDAKVRTFVPDRERDGYGVHLHALRRLREEGVDLVVTVDCGITAIEPVAAARAEGLSVLVTDHHRLPDDGRLPPAAAILHPDLPGAPFRWTACCGAVVAWKLAWALFDRWAGSPESRRLPASLRSSLARLLPLAAIGTVADVMPLLGENRAIVQAGIARIRDTGIPGLDALLRSGDIAREGIDSETVAYRIGPRLNAAGRMGCAGRAVRLLTGALDDRECRELVRELERANEERRTRERTVFEEAKRAVERAGLDAPGVRGIALAHPDWPNGVVGIVCSRMVEAFGRPTILLQDLGETCKGSGRAPPGCPLPAAIAAACERAGVTPVSGGGHDAAVGLTLRREDLPAFAAAFAEVADFRSETERSGPALTVDVRAVTNELSRDAIRELETLSPFGRGNPRPSVLLESVALTAPPRIIGAAGTHAELKLRAASGGPFLDAVWWGGAPRLRDLPSRVPLDLVVEPKIDRFLGEERVRLVVRDAGETRSEVAIPPA